MDPGRAEKLALKMEADGASAVDVGGESSRPGASAVDEKEELRRVLPLIRRLVLRLKIPVSIDSRKPAVQKAALDAGARIVNDISGGEDETTLEMAAAYKATLILMHMRGKPENMQKNPAYRNVRGAVAAFLSRRRKRALEAGLPAVAVVLDPGIGFGKSLAHNIQLMGSVAYFRKLGSPVMIGASRKSWIGKLTGREAADRLAGSLAAAALAAFQGADFLRVHDVRESLDAVRVGRAWGSN